MYFERPQPPVYRGSERYVVELEIREAGDAYDVKGTYVQFKIRPERVLLVWERYRTNEYWGEWKRRSSFRGGAKISGFRVLKDGTTGTQESYAELWGNGPTGEPLTTYAKSLPHLEQLVAELEKNLPK